LTLSFGSLFAGIGGLDLGLERAGMKCKWQVEIDDYATRVLEKHWPEVRRWRDVTTFPPEFRGSRDGTDVSPKTDWYVDLICGGFPCQDISYAGRGAGLEGERSGLFFEVLRVVRQLRPRYVLLENVAALLTRGLDRVLGELGQIGYDAEWHCIPAAAVGAPHIRDRVFVIARIADSQIERCGTGRSGRIVSTGAGQENAAEMANGRSTRGAAGISKPQQREEGNARVIIGRDKPGGWQEANQWSVEPDVGRVANGVSSRVDRLRGLGNAVVPQVAEWIGRQIIQFETERPGAGR
jgi:DNA (cytosine-5)-methyltransferase 1